jgi:hypothetical protein
VLIRVRFLFAFVSSWPKSVESAQSAIPLPFGHLSIRVSILFRISNFFFSALSPIFLSLTDAVNEKHGLCRNIRRRNAADPQNQESKKAVSDSFKKRPSQGRVYAVARLRRSSLQEHTADGVHQDV